MSDRLKGKRIIITGAVDNIGKEAVRAFLAEGARVVVGDINQGGRTVADEFGSAIHFLKVDVTDEGAIRNFIEAGVAWLGGLNVLCQNAGVQLVGNIIDYSIDDWDRSFAVNVR